MTGKVFRSSLVLYLLCSICGAGTSMAAEFTGDYDASLNITYPAEDTVLTETKFTFLYTRSGPAEELDKWDHTHFGVAPCDTGTAEFAIETADHPSVWDIDLILVNEGFLGDGCYRFCAYMAEADHTPMSDLVCHDFTVATNQFIVGSPKEGISFPTSKVTVVYNFAGKTKAAVISYRLNDNPIAYDQDLDGNIPLDLVNGDYSVEIAAYAEDGAQIGETIYRNFSVDSDLSESKLRKANKLARRIKDSTSRKSAKKLSRLGGILKKMSDVGGQHPTLSNLNSEMLTKARKFLRKAKKARKVGQDEFDSAMDRLRKHLKKMQAG